jgi:hypothetical protein
MEVALELATNAIGSTDTAPCHEYLRRVRCSDKATEQDSLSAFRPPPSLPSSGPTPYPTSLSPTDCAHRRVDDTDETNTSNTGKAGERTQEAQGQQHAAHRHQMEFARDKGARQAEEARERHLVVLLCL